MQRIIVRVGISCHAKELADRIPFWTIRKNLLSELKERGGVNVIESANWIAMPSQESLEGIKEVVAKAKEKFEQLLTQRSTSVSAKFVVETFYEPETEPATN